ncbi:hypothetical protein M0R45_030371 [Rubus argutus]|uniref:Uncharacterized protein n=1 Tax=Rubus argutus TaxID=59490 RepID=A0AAW1WAW1_RUBAR
MAHTGWARCAATTAGSRERVRAKGLWSVVDVVVGVVRPGHGLEGSEHGLEPIWEQRWDGWCGLKSGLCQAARIGRSDIDGDKWARLPGVGDGAAKNILGILKEARPEMAALRRIE